MENVVVFVLCLTQYIAFWKKKIVTNPPKSFVVFILTCMMSHKLCLSHKNRRDLKSRRKNLLQSQQAFYAFIKQQCYG